jgi:hypothetical protein
VDQETIQKIAQEVVRHLPNYAWVLLAAQLVLTVMAAAFGAFFGEYLRERGKNLATKADFDSLKTQLRANTELVETIKADVSQKDWARREWTYLRRTNLVALLNKMHDCRAYLEMNAIKAISGQPHLEPSPRGELDTIAALFFPELRLEVDAFLGAYDKQIQAGLALAQEAVIGRGTASKEAFDTYQAQTRGPELNDASTALQAAARNVMVKVMGVDDQA